MLPVPDDPQEWTDEQWLAWLDALDATAGEDRPPVPRPAVRDRLGARMLAASMRGLAEAIYGPKDEPAVVIEASGDPPDDGLDLHLDADHPEQSVVVVRPWLLRHLRDEAGGGPPAT